MSSSGKILDPVCAMIVDIAEAREVGLTLERPEREYAFCGAGCQARFAKSPTYLHPKGRSLARGATLGVQLGSLRTTSGGATAREG